MLLQVLQVMAQNSKELGHTIVQPRASLIPLETVESWPREVAGLTLRNVQATLTVDGRKVGSEFGEMLLLTSGLRSYHLIFVTGSCVRHGSWKSKIALAIDMKPALSYEQLDARILRDLRNTEANVLIPWLILCLDI